MKDRSRLVRKLIVDKNGVFRHVWVRPDKKRIAGKKAPPKVQRREAAIRKLKESAEHPQAVKRRQAIEKLKELAGQGSVSEPLVDITELESKELIPKKILVTRGGKTFVTTVWVKPETYDIPCVRIKELPERLQVGKYPTNMFKALLFDKFAGKRVKNRHTGANILIPKSGIKHSLQNCFSGDKNFPRATLYSIDKLLTIAQKTKSEVDKDNNNQVSSVDTYFVNVKVGYQEHSVKIIVKQRKDTGHNFYDHLVIKKKPGRTRARYDK